MAEISIAVEATSMSPTRLDVTARGFTFVMDEPVKAGGGNAGPNPVEYLLGALAGCINVVGHTVAGEMGFAIDELTIQIEGQLDPLAYLGKKPGVRPGCKSIRVRCDVHTSADDHTLAQWIQTVEARCPVSDNLRDATPLQMTIHDW